MGKKDIQAHEFLANNARFADLCNYFLFDGREIIAPDEAMRPAASLPTESNRFTIILTFETRMAVFSMVSICFSFINLPIKTLLE